MEREQCGRLVCGLARAPLERSADAAVQVAPPAATQVQVSPVIAAGNESAIVAPVTLEGPALENVIV